MSENTVTFDSERFWREARAAVLQELTRSEAARSICTVSAEERTRQSAEWQRHWERHMRLVARLTVIRTSSASDA